MHDENIFILFDMQIERKPNSQKFMFQCACTSVHHSEKVQKQQEKFSD
jgi:hypothetical protein